MDYREIKIYLNTNLEGEKNDKVPFQSSMLVHPDIKDRRGLNSSPYISFNSIYNFAPLSELTLQQRMEFFFNTSKHPLLLNIYPGLITKNVLSSNAVSRDAYISQSNHIIKNNIECMLQLLFLVSPLNSISVTGSLEMVTGKIEFPNLPTIYGLFNSVNKVKIVIDNKNYSFERLIWMNDFLNNPIYDDLFKRTKEGRGEKYIKFKNWLNDAIARTKNYSTNKNNNIVKANLETLYRFIMEKKNTNIDKNDIENIFKCLFLHYILNPAAGSSKKDDGAEFYDNLKKKNTVQDKQYKEIEKLIQERTLEKDSSKKTQQTIKIKDFLKNNPQFENLNNAFANNKIDNLNNEMTEFVTEYKKIKEQIEKIKNSKDTVDVAYLKSILDIVSFTSFTVDNMTEWFPKINDFFESKKDSLKNANNDTKKFIESLFDIGVKISKDVNLSFSSPSLIEKSITDNFLKACKEYLKDEEKNKKIREVLENMEKKTYDSVKKDVQNIGLNILYRQPGETIDFSIYNDFIFTFVNQELGLKHISSNEFLQNIISMKSNEDTKKFFDFLRDTYNHFYLGDSSSYKYANELFAGVNFSRDKNSYEIFVLCDLYSGDDDVIYGKQNCSNKNENLGKNLEYILAQGSIGLEKNRQKWDILYNRVSYVSPSNTNIPPSNDRQNVANIRQNPPPVQQNPPNVININIFNQILDDLERQSKKATIGKEKKPIELNYWQFDETLSLLENVNLYDRGRMNPINLLTNLSSGDEYEKKLYSVIGECFKTLNRYSQTVYNKLNLLKSEFSAVIENNVSQQKSSVPPLEQNEMIKLNAQCAKYFLYIKIIEKLSESENQKPKIGGFRRNKKYRTKRLRLSKKRFTRKNNYSRIY
jgi:hypothetical protein